MTIIERFLDKIDFNGPNGCHIWLAATGLTWKHI
jgi:hypothetical protein